MIRRLLVANRGEVAVRVLRSATELGVGTVAVAAAGDEAHLAAADSVHRLEGDGPAAYLRGDELVRVAVRAGCDAVHPGWGFLSESAAFARLCAEAGIVFVGPVPEHLELLGDKARARELAVSCGIPVAEATDAGVTLEQARVFVQDVGLPVLVKAVSGGGGRGVGLVTDPDDLAGVYRRCRSEAARATGDDQVYLERAITSARHIEVQLAGDGKRVVRLGERDCSAQLRHQKLIEMTPAPALPEEIRKRLLADGARIAEEIGYRGLATVEFLVNPDGYVFIEVNPRLQVEHTVTEEAFGLDLVAAQLRLAAGATLAEAGLDLGTARPVVVVQTRIAAAGDGILSGFAPCSGPGVRVDTALRAGDRVGIEYDPLLAKVVVTAPDHVAALAKARRALAGFLVEGVPTDAWRLDALLADPALAAGEVTTRFVDERLTDSPDPVAGGVVVAPTGGVVVEVAVTDGAEVGSRQPLVVLESMKMEHVVAAGAGGTVTRVHVVRGDRVAAGDVLISLDTAGVTDDEEATLSEPDLDEVRSDLAEVHARHDAVLDAARPTAVARRHDKGARTARENIEQLCDSGSFVEYGPLVVAGQRRRRSLDELIERTPADGLVMGFGQVNGAAFDRSSAQAFVLAFDETVLAGTMGELAREKIKNGLEVARQARTPVVLLAEGGGGRAGDTDGKVGVTGWSMDVSSYHQLARMSGLVPLVGVTAGHCFAANAGLLSCCDVIIATLGSNIGVGGPSMVEAGGLGRYRPEELGPVEEQSANGVVDLVADDEAAAVDLAKRYLAYFQGPLADHEAAEYQVPDQRRARFVVPENRLRAYYVREAVEVLADVGSVLELRSGYGPGMITALARVEGRPLGVVANDPMHLGGAVDSDGADKACRFMRLCEAFGLPLLMLCDTPGMMVGPDAERTATVRKMGRMFVTGANLSVPLMTIVLRKAYGLGAELMAGGWFKAPRFVVAWPTAELGGMNIEGNVRLAHAAELAAIADPEQRRRVFEERVAEMHAAGRALAVATHYEVDDVIDPADSRAWISSVLVTHRARPAGSEKRVPYVDPW